MDPVTAILALFEKGGPYVIAGVFVVLWWRAEKRNEALHDKMYGGDKSLLERVVTALTDGTATLKLLAAAIERIPK